MTATFTSNKPYLIRSLYEWIVDNDGTPHLIVNADFPGVQVPREHVQNGEIVLNISSSAVQGLALNNDEISFNARFSGVARVIRVPVAAVLAIVARENGQGMAFPPEEMDSVNAKENTLDQSESADVSIATVADDSIESEEPLTAKESKNNSPKERGSHLKLVK